MARRMVRNNKNAIDTASMIVSELRKKLPKEQDQSDVTLLSDVDVLADVTEWIPTGFPALDEILGGGWAVGRMSEVYGVEGCGKTALAHMALLAVQKQGGIAVLIDFEGELTKKRIVQYGINGAQLVYLRPDHGVQAWDQIMDIYTKLRANKPDAPFLIIWDSIAATPALSEEEEESAGDAHMADNARLNSKMLKKMTKRIQKIRAHLMFINQERDDIANKTPFKEPVTPGGKSVKYYMSQRIRMYRKNLKETVKGKPKVIGYECVCTTRKCRLAPPHQQAKFVLSFEYGPSPELSAFYALRDEKVLKLAGGRYKIPWYDKLIFAKQWMGLMDTDDDFYTAAMDAYRGLTYVEEGAEDAPDEDLNPADDED